MYKDSSTPTKIPQSVRKRDNKVKTFAPKDSKIDSLLKDFEIDSSLKNSKIDSSLKHFEINSLPSFNEKSNRLKNLREEYQNITEEKIIPNLNKIINTKDILLTQ